ncbi:Hypothetical protein NTJ_04732 [Nesidiocoris tenuis]|uniref:Uncharacterized protein n=1 Tax=Nesidiocoris tenuis TaxID=355587 RepID=A0ABN7AKI0_9HEMI|nr:Hypothetical protein NTJ_04732 [Nesidiocoris tenuis]
MSTQAMVANNRWTGRGTAGESSSESVVRALTALRMDLDRIECSLAMKREAHRSQKQQKKSLPKISYFQSMRT